MNRKGVKNKIIWMYLSGEGEGDAPEAEVVVVSPPLQRVKAISEASEASDPSSVNSQGWEDTGEVKLATLG